MSCEKDFELPNWIDYKPCDLDYYSNTARQDLLCRFKLTQVYQNFCIARMNCIFSDKKNNYGDLDPENKNKEWLEKIFLQNALLYYNICVDLSWCMVYFYCASKSEESFNITEKEIEKIEEEINYDNLKARLEMSLKISNFKDKKKLERILELTTEFWNDKIPKEFRQDYNYIKHRGTFDIFDDFKNDENTSLFLIDGIKPNITVPRFKKFDSEEYINILRDFHVSFLKYMNDLIDIIIKPHYNPSKYSIKEIINNVINNSKKE